MSGPRRRTLQLSSSLFPHQPSRRAFTSSTFTRASTPTDPDALPIPSARTLASIKSRLGECIKFGLTPAQTTESAALLATLARDWRELLAGAEGFLTAPGRRGLYRQEVVWGEQDCMGHVNNVVYNRYAESARVNWTERYASHVDPAHAAAWRALCTPRGDGLILRRMETDFKFPMTYPDRVTVYHRLLEVPKAEADGFRLGVVILSEKHWRPAARCVEDIVLYDYKQHKKLRLGARPFILKAFEETWRLQQEAKGVWRERVMELEKAVRRIEVGSWDSPNAVEDLGSAQSPS